jgi:hypothetical protein
VTTTRGKTRTDEPVPQKFCGVVLGHRHSVQPELWWDDERRPCVVCREPTHWRRPRRRGAPTHPECEGTVFDTASEELHVEVLYSIMDAFDVAEVREIDRDETPPRPVDRRRVGTPDAGCSFCGRGFSALWIRAGLWTCPLHNLIPIRYGWTG